MNLNTLAVLRHMCHKGEMEAEVDLQSGSRETLLAVIAELRRRVEELEALLSSRGPTAGMPGNKPSVKRHQPEMKGRGSVVSTALPGGGWNPRSG